MKHEPVVCIPKIDKSREFGELEACFMLGFD